MLGDNELIAFTATTGPERSLAFYRDVVGLRLIADEEFAIVFDAHGTMLRIQKAAEHTPPPFTALGWKVDDIARAIAELTAKGVEMVRYPGFDQDADGVWTTPDGGKVAWFHDPDRNLLSLTEWVTE
ncbi:MAG: VOC family protein [Gordonia sp. (in: high G+C Gram-positive bacteria)]|uniref:VOC family protein n=1 Tax=Gordonia sp. (in: high G+C Gram-positive bacteria) TaxID=84139 RepID=UPI0039E3C269